MKLILVERKFKTRIITLFIWNHLLRLTEGRVPVYLEPAFVGITILRNNITTQRSCFPVCRVGRASIITGTGELRSGIPRLVLHKQQKTMSEDDHLA